MCAIEIVGTIPNSKGTGKLSFFAGRMVCGNAVFPIVKYMKATLMLAPQCFQNKFRGGYMQLLTITPVPT